MRPSVNASAKGKHLFTFLTSLFWTFNWNCSPNMKIKRLLLYKKLFILCNELKKQFAEINSSAVHLSGPYCKIRTAKVTNQNSSFHRGPCQFMLMLLYTVASLADWKLLPSFRKFQSINDKEIVKFNSTYHFAINCQRDSSRSEALRWA